MDFGMSDEQELLQDSFARYLEEETPILTVRELMELDDPCERGLWQDLAELGAAGVIIPEEHGGSDLGLLDAALIAESFGRFATPAPFLGTAVMAPVALTMSGSADLQAKVLPRIAVGELRVGVCVAELYSAREDAAVRLVAGRLHGKSLLALDAIGADAFLVAAGPHDLLWVPSDTKGVTVEALATIDDTRRFAEVCFDAVEPAASIGAPGGAAETIDRMLDAGRVILAADTLGAANEMIRRAVEYAQDRKQFDRVIASFQAVKHMCAEMVAPLEPARSLLWYAAHAFDNVPEDATLMATHIKAHLSEIARDIAKTATEVHGGVGFTDEQQLHVWFKRIELNRQVLGSPEFLRERVAQIQDWAA